MNFNIGWIKLHRKLFDWEWYSDVNVRLTFFHFLLLANYEDKKWQGIEIKKGSFISSISKLSQQIGISEQQVRTSIKKLKSTNELTIKTTNKYSMFTIVSYDLYQTDNEQNNKRETNEQQSNNNQITTTKEVNNIIIKEINKYSTTYGQNMINQFIEYWFSKEKPTHLKTRFEKQKTFDVKKRLQTWFKNTNDFTINNLNFYLSNDTEAKEVFISLYPKSDFDKAVKWFADKKIKEGAIKDSYLNYKKHFFNSIKNI